MRADVGDDAVPFLRAAPRVVHFREAQDLGFECAQFRVGLAVQCRGEQFLLGGSQPEDGRLMVAATLLLSNGEGRIWSDYGQWHRCIGPDDATRYTR